MDVSPMSLYQRFVSDTHHPTFTAHVVQKCAPFHGSFIPSRTYPIPLDLGSQAGLGENSTAVGDHVGSPRDELFLLFFWHCSYTGLAHTDMAPFLHRNRSGGTSSNKQFSSGPCLGLYTAIVAEPHALKYEYVSSLFPKQEAPTSLHSPGINAFVHVKKQVCLRILHLLAAGGGDEGVVAQIPGPVPALDVGYIVPSLQRGRGTKLGLR